MSYVIEARNLKKVYEKKEEPIVALQDVNLTIAAGEFVAIMGPSGSGKSTLLNLFGALDIPTEGNILINGEDTTQMTPHQLDTLRRRIGFVFQDFNLIERLPAVKNVELGIIIQNLGHKDRRAKALQILNLVGLADRANHKPSELSAGQKQRVAIARALGQNPSFLLMDEPTGNVDVASRVNILTLVNDLNATQGITTIIITHDSEVARYAHRVIQLVNGKIKSDEHSSQYLGERLESIN